MEKNISKYLAFRWMALYMLFYDDNLDRADFALSEKIVELEEKVRRTDGSASPPIRCPLWPVSRVGMRAAAMPTV